MTKHVLLFMTTEDERVFSTSLTAQFPHVSFLDNNVWATPDPVLAASIDLCISRYVYMWNKDIFPAIPIAPRIGGGFRGPGIGPVAQFQRSLQEPNILRSGRLDLGLSDEKITPEIDYYFKEVWKIVKKSATSKLICVSPETGLLINPQVWGYWAWPDAVAWCRAEKGRFLRDRATQNFYLPA